MLQPGVSPPPLYDAARPVRGLRRPALYPVPYTWFVFLGALDLLFTVLILHPVFGAREVNVLANWIMTHGGLRAIVLYKFGLVAMIILICEVVGSYRERAGRRLAEWSVAITAIPVTFTSIQLIVAILAGLHVPPAE